jgi:mannose-1-phosphate guanylyltransferase/mannose-6-phosphate isomerase
MVSHLNELSRDEQLFHRKVYRPWGWYDSIEVGENFQVKRLNISPGAKLSLQLHHKRSEHWVVVKGIATVNNNEQILTLHEGQSTYIPVGIKHSLENQTKMDLEIIEVQTGSYLGEDDIVRFDDIYGRHKY